MIRNRFILPLGACVFAGAASVLPAQDPVPVPPRPMTRLEREAAAAIQPPQAQPALPSPVTPPPLPGQLQGSALPTAAAPAPAPPAPQQQPPAPASLSKMEALDAATRPPAFQEVPRVTAPGDKIPVTTSTSKTGQFVVHGKVFETRSAMSSHCENIAEELRKVLNDREPFVLPIVVQLNTGEEAAKNKGAAVSTAITELSHGGFHVQVTVNDRGTLKASDLRKELVRALLAERILRNQSKISTPEGRLLLPDWVMTGVLHAMDYKATARPSAIFSAIFRSGKIYGIEEIIAASPVEMDNLSRSIYETSCCALVLALVDQPEGTQRFNKFLSSLASDPRSERELLDAAFPKFTASASSLNKWWSLQMASLSKPGLAEPLTAAESLKAIEEAIQIHYAAKPDDVPKDVKARPFVLPQPIYTAPPPQPKPVPQPLAAQDSPPERRSSPAPRNKVTPDAEGSAPEPTAEAGTEEEADGKPKTALWRRMLFLGAPKPDEQPPETTPAGNEAAKARQDAAMAEAAAGGNATPEEKPVEKKPEDKPGFMSRLLGGGRDAPPKSKPTAEEENPAERAFARPAEAKEKPAPKPEAKPKEKPQAEPKPAEEDKPSKLNPMNWFRGGKKEEAPTAKTPEKQSSLLPAQDQSLPLGRLLSPALADAWELLGPSAPRQTVDILNVFKRKKQEEAEAPPTPAPAPEPKPQAKKPASAPRKPRTNNPNAKPVPAALLPRRRLQPPPPPLPPPRHLLRARMVRCPSRSLWKSTSIS